MRNIFVGKNELAQAYFPFISESSARHKLMAMIDGDGELKRKLLGSGYNPKSHAFSPVQVEMIMKELGNPFR